MLKLIKCLFLKYNTIFCEYYQIPNDSFRLGNISNAMNIYIIGTHYLRAKLLLLSGIMWQITLCLSNVSPSCIFNVNSRIYNTEYSSLIYFWNQEKWV